MSPFTALLTLYYLCDQAASAQALDRTQVQTCMANYETLKLSFVETDLAPQGSPERAAQNQMGYARFKAWEAENPEIVEGLRRTARTHLGLG